MSSFNFKTKKEIILENAYRDPFLKIDDLAKKADTTSRYVRTILSESSVSLMELRKQYARKIENKKYNFNDRLILNYLMKIPFQSKEKVLKIDDLLLNNPLDIDDLSSDVRNQYVYNSYKYIVKNKSWGLCTVFTDKEYYGLTEEDISFKGLLDLLNSKMDENDLDISNINIVVDISTGLVNQFLGISNLSPVLRIKQTICKESDVLALLLVYFDTQQVSLSLSHSGGFAINRKRAIE
ncbi:MAG: hypothetical protein ACLFPF_04490 [Halanaerobiales bacterium]